MPETLHPPAPDSPPFPSGSGSVDSVSAPSPPLPLKTASPVPGGEVQKTTSRLRRLVVIFYGAYTAWCLVLIVLLPSASPALTFLKVAGLFSLVACTLSLLGAGFFSLQRVFQATDVPTVYRKRGLLRVLLLVLPGLLLAGWTALSILREPPLFLDIKSPSPDEMVAPVAVTLSAERAAETLRLLGHTPVQYAWDTDGDGKVNEETVLPVTTAVYEKAAAYVATVRIQLSEGSSRTVARRVLIPRAVFSVTPLKPVRDKPVHFSVEHLLQDPKLLKEVQWDLDGDGTQEETTKIASVFHTYYSIGSVPVTAILLLTNGTQTTFKRTITVEEPPAPPFPLTLVAEPRNLVGPVPFGALFRVETTEPLREISWDFGDGKQEAGADLTRVGHLFEKPGTYAVVTKIRSVTGALAEITTLVRATPPLQLPDLRFDGKPEVTRGMVRGEVPLTVELTPRTSVPLIQFSWEAGDGASVESPSSTTVRAVYRREGTYTLTLIAQDPEGKAMRLPLKVVSDPPKAEPAISVRPETGEAPLRAVFDASETFIPPGQEIAGFKWFFGDDASGKNPELGAARIEHTYRNPGEYTVTLVVVMASGTEYKATRTIVVRRPVLSACITASRLKVQTGKAVEFDSSCSTGNVVNYVWDIRYDAQPDVVQAQSPTNTYVHVFDLPGEYSVSLTIKDQAGNQDTKKIAVSVSPSSP